MHDNIKHIQTETQTPTTK